MKSCSMLRHMTQRVCLSWRAISTSTRRNPEHPNCLLALDSALRCPRRLWLALRIAICWSPAVILIGRLCEAPRKQPPAKFLNPSKLPIITQSHSSCGLSLPSRKLHFPDLCHSFERSPAVQASNICARHNYERSNSPLNSLKP